jgi:hypothetical protein
VNDYLHSHEPAGAGAGGAAAVTEMAAAAFDAPELRAMVRRGLYKLLPGVDHEHERARLLNLIPASAYDELLRSPAGGTIRPCCPQPLPASPARVPPAAGSASPARPTPLGSKQTQPTPVMRFAESDDELSGPVATPAFAVDACGEHPDVAHVSEGAVARERGLVPTDASGSSGSAGSPAVATQRCGTDADDDDGLLARAMQLECDGDHGGACSLLEAAAKTLERAHGGQDERARAARAEWGALLAAQGQLRHARQALEGALTDASEVAPPWCA